MRSGMPRDEPNRGWYGLFTWAHHLRPDRRDTKEGAVLLPSAIAGRR